jgi:DNA-binding CsgD family transcriptional regulator
MAEDLGVSVATVRNHIDHLFRMLQVHNRVQAVAAGRRHSLID